MGNSVGSGQGGAPQRLTAESATGLPGPVYLVGQRADPMLPPPELPSCLGLPQHPNQHGSKHPVLLAVDQELGEGPRLRVPPELADPVGSLEVGEHQDVEQLGAGSRSEGVQALAECCSTCSEFTGSER